MRLIDVVDNGAELTVQDATILRNALCKEICGMNMDDILHCDKNARRLLLKRGNADENDGYVGLSGEVTVDTDMQTFRDSMRMYEIVSYCIQLRLGRDRSTNRHLPIYLA